jgi:putative phage-type endonuclease
MIVHTMEQRSPEWYEVRAGKLTASCAGKLITPTGRPSTQYKGEIARILAEQQGLQEPEQLRPSYWMERGIDMEEEAQRWLAVETGLDIEPVGFIEDHTGYFGVSPDGIIREDETIIPVELKCPKPSTHIQWLIEGGVPKEHLAQVHMAMLIAKSRFAYFMSYCPECQPLIVKVEIDDYTQTLADQMDVYIDEMEDAQQKLFPGGNDEEV